MKKILFILHYPPPVHGASVVGRSIIESAQINGTFRCKYINLSTSTTLDEIGGRLLVKAFRLARLWFEIFIALVRFRPSLCYLTLTSKGIGFFKDAFIVILVKALGIPCVYHFHNKGVSDRQDKPLDDLLYRLVFKKADVILVSKRLYPDIRKYVPEARVHYCSNGIPEISGRLRPGGPGLLRETKSDHRKATTEILFLSNLIESKGVFVLLEACALLRKKDLSFHCTYVGGIGDVTEEKFREKVTRLALDDKVRYAGKKYGEEKERQFAESDILAFPTYKDIFGLVILEAMQQSLPVVSTYEGGIPDLVEDGVTGFLVPQRDADALAAKLELLIDNPDLRHQLGAAGRKKYEREFTLERFEGRMTEILSSLSR